MESIKKIFRIGTGPSSSHTMGPERAAGIFKARCPDAARYRAILYGSLAATGKGHLTDIALKKIFGDQLEIVWNPETELPFHPNGLKFHAIDKTDSVTSEATFYSTGGGAISEGGEKKTDSETYSLTDLEEILNHCRASKLSLDEYVFDCEGQTLLPYLDAVWKAMDVSIENGLQKRGHLPGSLKLKRKAQQVFLSANQARSQFSSSGFISAFALAVSEENADGGVIVTAPTCGSCGVIPAVLRYLQTTLDCDNTSIIKALAIAGLIGTIVKHNASISGAEAGCQAEIGTACAMAAASAAYLLGGDLSQIEYAAEMGMEHHLGLTCDPVCGLVQIPCIERNAFAANRALTCASYSISTGGEHIISFDEVVQVMMETGKDIAPQYRETSKGGLARIYQMKQSCRQ